MDSTDGKFNYSINTDPTDIFPEGSEIVSFSAYKVANDTFYDSEGTSYSNGSNITPKNFTVPDVTPGFYRMRFKVDWNNIDPSGQWNSDGTNLISGNGGIILDTRINIHGDNVTVKIADGITGGSVQTTDGATTLTTEGVTTAFGTDYAIKFVPNDEYYKLKSVVIRHGYNLTGEQYIYGNKQWDEITLTEAELEAAVSTGYTIAADNVDGDILITPYFSDAIDVTLRTVEDVEGVTALATFSSSRASTIPSGVTAYYIAEEPTENVAVLTPINGTVIPANEGVILTGEAGTYALEPSTESGTDISATNKLEATSDASKTIADGDNVYVLGTPNTATRYLQLTIGTGTTNEGCFFGLGAITLSNSSDATETVKLTFNRTGTDASSVTVTASDANDNALSTTASLQSTSHTFKATTGDVTSSILCPNTNATAKETFILLFELNNLPGGYTFDEVGLEIHALSGSNTYQSNSDGKTRQWNVGVTIGTSTTELTELSASYTDLDIAAGVGTSGAVYATHEATANPALTTEATPFAFYPATIGTTLGAHKAYLVVSSGTNAPSLSLQFGGSTSTGLDKLTPVTENANAPIYDLSGRRVLKAVKGNLYIQNGNKFIAK